MTNNILLLRPEMSNILLERAMFYFKIKFILIIKVKIQFNVNIPKGNFGEPRRKYLCKY